MRGRPLAELTPYEALMRGFGDHFRLDAEGHASSRAALERAVEQAPRNANCWAMLSWVTSHEHAHVVDLDVTAGSSLQSVFFTARRSSRRGFALERESSRYGFS